MYIFAIDVSNNFVGAITPGSDWLDAARPVIQKRIDKYDEISLFLSSCVL